MRVFFFVVMTLPIGCNPYAENWFIAQDGSVVPATIVALDTARREVTISTENRGTFTLPAGRKVRNLSRLAVGDEVEVWYYPMRILAFFDPSDRTKGAISSSYYYQVSYGDTAPVFMVVTFLSYDGDAMLRTPDGFTREAWFNGDLDSYAERLRPGDRVGVALDWPEAVKFTRVPPN